jgi:acetyltransferase-like isoleucine patch superfamily enzyme
MSQRRLNRDWFSHPFPENVQLDERSWLYSSYAFVHCRSERPDAIRVGRDSGLYHGTFFDTGPDAEIEIGKYCSLVGVIFATNGRVTIGDYSFLAHEVVLTDSHWTAPQNLAGRATAMSKNSVSGGNIDIGRNVWIGTQVVVVGRLRIGEGAIVGAGTIVTGDVPPYSLCVGNPMRIARSLPRAQNSAAEH